MSVRKPIACHSVTPTAHADVLGKQFHTCASAVLVVLLLFFVPILSAQTLSLTFDDGFDPASSPRAAEWNARMLDALRVEGVKAMIFPTLRNIGSGEGLGLVEAWGAAGHSIGNHTATHRSLSSPAMTPEEFIADVTKADIVLNGLPNFKPMLRFPYLNEGDDVVRRDGIRNWLKTAGYRAAPVSIDASDWYYSQLFVSFSGSGKDEQADAIKRAYLEHLLDRAKYYDDLAIRYLGRSPPHVILLHTNALNAEALSEVIRAFRRARWNIVSPEIAFADSLYAARPNALPAGQSVVWALAKDAGAEDLRYPAEDSVYEEPRLRRLGILE